VTAADRAAGLVAWWVEAYTRHLPDEVAGRRRAEVDSDLWEQRAAGRRAWLVAFSILRRMAAGMPADLHWRHGQLAAARGRLLEPRARPVLAALARNWWLVAAALVGTAEVVAGIRMALAGDNPVIGTGATARTGTTTGSGILFAAAGLLLLAGIAWRRRSPTVAGTLIAAGAFPAMLLLLSAALPAAYRILLVKPPLGGAGLLLLGLLLVYVRLRRPVRRPPPYRGRR
jgi:hypothetical protein